MGGNNMKYTKAMRIGQFYDTMSKMGFSYAETETLRRAQMTLSRWSEAECNGEIERNEKTGKPERVSQAWLNGRNDKRHAWPCPDRETGALKRAQAVVDARNAREAEPLRMYHQGDPRGCSLYLVRASDVPDGSDIGSYYSRGFGVCV